MTVEASPQPVCTACGSIGTVNVEALLAGKQEIIDSLHHALAREQASTKGLRAALAEKRERTQPLLPAARGLFDYWRTTCNREKTKGFEKRADRILRWLKADDDPDRDKFTEAECRRAIDGYAAFPNVGDKGRVRVGGRRFNDFELIFRDEEMIGKGLKLADRADAERPPVTAGGSSEHGLALFGESLSGLDGAEKLEAFEQLPEDTQSAAWDSLAVSMAVQNEERRTAACSWFPLEDLPPEMTSAEFWLHHRHSRRTERPALRAVTLPETDDALLVAPPTYVEALTGEEVPRSGTIRCPLPDHDERTPSCQVYPEADRGWYCFGCHRGGTVYDLAAALWDLPTRGSGFVELKERVNGALRIQPVQAVVA